MRCRRIRIILPLLQLRQPRREELELLHRDRLRGTGHSCRFILLRRPRAQRVLEVAVDGVVQLALALRERQWVELKRLAVPAEVLALPLLDGRLGFEVGEVLERKAFVLAVQLLRAFFAAMDDRVDVVVDHQAAESSV